MRNCQRGFSLLETLVVASIAGTLAAVTIPNLSGAVNAHRLQGGLRTSVGAIRVARSAAISRNIRGRVTVSDDGKTLTVEVERAGTGWTAIGTPRMLDGGVSVASVSPANGLLFNSQGTVTNGVTVTLQNARGDTRQIAVSLLGGVEVS
jgi:prepilin-type N-terminal cleavage/methylation domain-containing protein